MNQKAVTDELSQRPTKNDVNNAIAAINDELAKKGNKNTALKSSKGWFKDESTGMIMQWGIGLSVKVAAERLPLICDTVSFQWRGISNISQ
ncbi:hypothetical protein CSB69_2084 [Morganella morganii]|uniref:hypothetical protein n=1 Tax=Morganella morganii TaxID=582 RepID=UPI000CF9264B|nr:hypothetical protein [Morganella morganii]AVK37162.1 hypothetical protein CSB69_2084 [Morganella morganii]